MPGSTTTRGHLSTRITRPNVLPSATRTSSAPRITDSIAARWLAYASLCRRFTSALASSRARLEVNVVRYTFIIMESHHVLPAGLPAHSRKSVPKKTGGIPLDKLLAAHATGSDARLDRLVERYGRDIGPASSIHQALFDRVSRGRPYAVTPPICPANKAPGRDLGRRDAATYSRHDKRNLTRFGGHRDKPCRRPEPSSPKRHAEICVHRTQTVFAFSIMSTKLGAGSKLVRLTLAAENAPC
jgi:hypothetical protein